MATSVSHSGERSGVARAGLKVVCARCRYPLKGLAVDGVCPECAYPIERSLPGGMLQRMDVYELGGVRAALGQWGAMLLTLGFFSAAMGAACPSLLRFSGVFNYAQAIVQAVLMVAAVFMWWPLMRLRRQASNARVRRAGVLTAAALCLGAVFLLSGKLGERFGVFNPGAAVWASWFCYYAGLAATLIGRVLFASFFVFGLRFTGAMSHDGRTETRRYRWAVVSGVIGALLPLVVDAMQVPYVARLIWTSTLRDGVAAMVSYGVVVGSGVLVGLACLGWTRACDRVERRTMERIDEMDAVKLKKQLEGAA